MEKNNKPKIWRMAFRCGNRGPSLWEECKEHKVAAITYAPLAKVNLTNYPIGEPKHLWKQLAGPQHASLRHLAYDMKKRDIIYVKEGAKIICKGIVCGDKQRAYQFDKKFRIIDPNDFPWPHQVPVEWDESFTPIDIVLGGDQHTVLELTGERLKKLEDALKTDASIELTVAKDIEDIEDEEDKKFDEGGRKSKLTNYYERDPKLRAEAIKIHKTKCQACGFDFFEKYGEHGKDYIEVHHKKLVSSLKEKTKICPRNDMDVVCSNCHRMLHRKTDKVLTIEELRKIIHNSMQRT